MLKDRIKKIEGILEKTAKDSDLDETFQRLFLFLLIKFVSANSFNSATRSINIGVPQGSILGPLLFLIYVNDLPNALSCKTSLFADDTCLVSTNSTISDLETDCNLQMDKLNKWCDANELQN